MNIATYFEEIESEPFDSKGAGKLLGEAIFDKDVKPEQYEKLCLLAKQKGFKFGKDLAVPA